jgi:hypothetical protein
MSSSTIGVCACDSKIVHPETHKQSQTRYRSANLFDPLSKVTRWMDELCIIQLLRALINVHNCYHGNKYQAALEEKYITS